VAALDGVAAAASVRAYLSGTAGPGAPAVALAAAPPFRWVSPHLVRPGDPPPPRGHLLLWPEAYVRAPVVVLRQAGRVLARHRVWWPAAPGRVFRVPFGPLGAVLPAVDPAGGPVTVGINS
jgi:hypothetical protein